jgi:hypothetical protein
VMMIAESMDKHDKYVMVKYVCLCEEEDITRGAYEAKDLIMVLLWHVADCLLWRRLKDTAPCSFSWVWCCIFKTSSQ